MFKQFKYITLAALVAFSTTPSIFATAVVTDVYKETIDNVTLEAHTLSPEESQKLFGMDMYGADIIPVEISIKNNSLEPRIFSANSLCGCGLITKHDTLMGSRFHTKDNCSKTSTFLAYLAGCFGVTFILDTTRALYNNQQQTFSLAHWSAETANRMVEIKQNSNLMAIASKALATSCIVIPAIGLLMAIRKNLATSTALVELISDKNTVIDSGNEMITYAFIDKRDSCNGAYINLNVYLQGYMQRTRDHHSDAVFNHQSEITFNAMIPNLK